MEIFHFSHTDIPDLPHSVLAMGFFDGFHNGHRALVSEARKKGTELGLPWGILTFDPDPWTVFRPGEPLVHIQTLEDRERMAEASGADLFCVLEFTKSFASLRPEEFHHILNQIHADYIVAGFDFQYGIRNSGNTSTLKDAGFELSVIEAVRDLDGKISSTRIESCIRDGKVREAAEMLGQDFSVAGKVVHGYQRGSGILRFPTANLAPDPGYVLPAEGVYAGFVLVRNKLYKAMINVGINPTFRNHAQSIEAFLFDFSGNLYGEKARFFFSEYLRPERKFDSPDELRKQLADDAETAGRILKGRKPDPLKVWNVPAGRTVRDIEGPVL